jgi:hypothetical protein
MAKGRHDVDLHGSDANYVGLIGALAAEALREGAPCVVIATARHRAALAARLRRLGVLARDGAVVAPGRLVMVDAAQTLARFTVGGWPDAARFNRVIGGVLRDVRGNSRRRPQVFGEMVALLLEAEGAAASLALERLWNSIMRRLRFDLVCSYSLRSLQRRADAASLLAVCAAHHAVIA